MYSDQLQNADVSNLEVVGDIAHFFGASMSKIASFLKTNFIKLGKISESCNGIDKMNHASCL